jgi:hypothetical protein
MKLVIATSLGLSLLGMAAVSSADPIEPGTVQIPVIKIVGRVIRPLASVEVNRLRPELRPREPEGSFLDRAGGAVQRDPF